jgi:hypothetical protein
MFNKIAGQIVAVLMFITIAGVMMTFPTMWLWNWLMPAIFSLPPISAWQAFGLLWLSNLLLNRSGSK